MQDWNHLQLVLAIARGGGLSGAARALGATHATMSRRLDRAEAEAGVKLFSRRPSGLTPTEAGQEMIDHAARIEAEIFDLDRALSARDDAASGPLSVAVAPLVADAQFGRDIGAFAQDNPNVRLSVLASNEILNIHRREADVAIRVMRAPAESLWGRVIAPQRNGWFATPEFIARHRAAFDGDPNAPAPIVTFKIWDRPVPPSLSRLIPGAAPVIACDDMAGAVAIAESGFAMVRMPHFLAHSHPALVRAPGLPLTDYMPIWCLTHPDLRRVSRVSALMGFLAARFAARRDVYFGPDAEPTPHKA